MIIFERMLLTLFFTLLPIAISTVLLTPETKDYLDYFSIEIFNEFNGDLFAMTIEDILTTHYNGGVKLLKS